MIVSLLVAILAVLLFGAPQILEWGRLGGAIALCYVVGFILLASTADFIAGAIHSATDALVLLFCIIAMAAWIWSLVKFKVTRWPSAIALFAFVAVVQLWPVAKALAG